MEDEKQTEKATLFDIPLTLCTFKEGIGNVEAMVASDKAQLLVLANAHTFNLAYEQSEYRQVLKRASMVLRDGSGVAWAVRKKGHDPLHNFVGTDFIPNFCKITSDKGYRIFLFGGKEGIAESAKARFETLSRGITISGTHCGYLKEGETESLIKKINDSRSDILLVAMGNPMQEFWIAENLEKINVKVCIGVGALFDYISGNVKRAPQWMLDAGIEWIFRLITEPGRLWKRYILGNPKFIFRVYKDIRKSARKENRFQ